VHTVKVGFSFRAPSVSFDNYTIFGHVLAECVLCVIGVYECVLLYVPNRQSVFSVFRPEVCENRCQIMIRDGRHPAIDLLMGENNQYVPNHTQLQVHTHTHTHTHTHIHTCTQRESYDAKLSQNTHRHLPAH